MSVLYIIIILTGKNLSRFDFKYFSNFISMKYKEPVLDGMKSAFYVIVQSKNIINVDIFLW